MTIKFPKALMGTAAVAMVATAAVAAPALADEQQQAAKQQATVTARGAANGGAVAGNQVLSVDDVELLPECEAIHGPLDEVWGEDVVLDGEAVDGDVLMEDWEPTADEIDVINAETDAIVAFLAAKGHDVSVETDEYGLRFPALDDLFETLPDEELNSLLDEFFAKQYGDDFGDLVFASGNVVGDATNGTAVSGDLVIVDDVKGLDLEDLDIEMLDDALTELDTEEWEPTAEDRETINAGIDAIVAALAEQGIEVAVETDEDGFRHAALDDLTDEQMDEIVVAIDAFHRDQHEAEMAKLGIDAGALEVCGEALFGEFGEDDLDLVTEAVPFEEDADS